MNYPQTVTSAKARKLVQRPSSTGPAAHAGHEVWTVWSLQLNVCRSCGLVSPALDHFGEEPCGVTFA